MKRTLLSAAFISIAFCAQAQTELTVRIDTKIMYNVDCNLLGDGAGGPAQVSKVYMHSGACSENRGSNQALSAQQYCLQEILPFASDVWQHVVGNWGANPQDDGVGQMTDIGNGLYEMTYVVEDYYSDPLLVSTEQNSTGTTVSSPLPQGNTVHVIGMVFRNESGQASGRDQQGCNDIFVVDFATDNPQIINSTDFSACTYVQIIKATGVEDAKHLRQISVAPNPATDNLTVTIDTWQALESASLSLINMFGQEVTAQSAPLAAGNNRMDLDVSTLGSGIYTVRLQGRSGLLGTQRIVLL